MTTSISRETWRVSPVRGGRHPFRPSRQSRRLEGQESAARRGDRFGDRSEHKWTQLSATQTALASGITTRISVICRVVVPAVAGSNPVAHPHGSPAPAGFSRSREPRPERQPSLLSPQSRIGRATVRGQAMRRCGTRRRLTPPTPRPPVVRAARGAIKAPSPGSPHVAVRSPALPFASGAVSRRTRPVPCAPGRRV